MNDYKFRELYDGLTEMSESQLEAIIQKAQRELQYRQDASARQLMWILAVLGIIAFLVLC